MYYGVEGLRKITDLQELIIQAGHTVHMLVNECEGRDKSDINDYLRQAEAILDLIHDRASQDDEDDDE